MRVMIGWLAVLLIACVHRVPGSTTISVDGRVVDPHGTPIAGADVLVCTTYHCGTVEVAAETSPASLAELAARARMNPGSFALATTSSDGRWRVRLAPSGVPEVVRVIAGAPGHALDTRDVWPRTATHSLEDDLTLRPASSLDVDARCGEVECTDELVIEVSTRWPTRGTHLERLEAGHYTVDVHANRRRSGERRGMAVVDVPTSSRALRVRVDLQPTGTGQAIEGVALERWPDAREGHENAVKGTITASCTDDVYRTATIDDHGAFTLSDVGPPPCKLTVNPRVHVEPQYDGLPDRIVTDSCAIPAPTTVTELPSTVRMIATMAEHCNNIVGEKNH